MNNQNVNIQKVIDALQERTKELDCMYQVEELIQNGQLDVPAVLNGVIKIVPLSWQYFEVCQVQIKYLEQYYRTPNFQETPWRQKSAIRFQEEEVGFIEVSYIKDMPEADEGPFLKEERRLLDNLSDRLGHYIMHQHLKRMVEERDSAKAQLEVKKGKNSRIIMDLLYRTDPELFIRISRKLLNHLCRNGINEAEDILQILSSSRPVESQGMSVGVNIPTKRKPHIDSLAISRRIFEVGYNFLSDEEFIALVEKWMQEDKASFLFKALSNPGGTLDSISDALRRFQQINSKEQIEFPESIHRSLRVQLIRKVMTGKLGFIKIAKEFVHLNDFIELFPLMIFPNYSHGRLGGKASGLFVAAQVLKKAGKENKYLQDLKVPKTFYITSDGLHNFLRYNDLDDVLEQKYKDIGQVRQEYPQLIEIFKNSKFPPEIIHKLSMALDELREIPLIVRSSSLLEDQLGSAFSGKYESFFLGNQGRKRERMEALLDAIAEVYASTFSPDPIEYRAERDLLDSREEMGILIQEVVGNKVGPYFLPAFAGVAFSNNEFRWSHRIKREDGLIRMVPGLGTRAVDRLSDDYPVLLAPGQPGLRVNVTEDEIIRYSPRKLDVMNLNNNSFETIDLVDFVRKYGDEFPAVYQLISVVKDGRIQQPSLVDSDFENSQPVATFDGLIKNTHFVKQVHEMLTLLQDKFNVPVDIEFASDGKYFYLLQCRPQSYHKSSKPAPIPKNIPQSAMVFSANRYVSNGHVPDITHIVYVDPQKYSEIKSKKQLLDVGKAVSKLNMNLPKRQFILMGPGRWGSRGDIKLGVSVTYSDINNTAVLIEIARKKGNYVPDLSFGTHFFQDLVESEIRYLPLYPDDEGVVFNEKFLSASKNILPDILPEFDYLKDILRVIDIPEVTKGKSLKILMNADLDEAVGILSKPSLKEEGKVVDTASFEITKESEDHWRWRYKAVECLAGQLDPDRFGVKAFYIFGSTKNGTASPDSDIDILLHFNGTAKQKKELYGWLEGWSLCLDEMNFNRTGYRSGGLLDVQLVTDEDIVKRSSYAAKIGAVTDAAREIKLKDKSNPISAL